MENIQNTSNLLQNIANIINDISNKTNVINDIVFKTQLLSFNASIEAARAGQHGKGFAVVAEEVGNLASMSGGAAGEIAGLLDDSKKQVGQILDSIKGTIEEGQAVTDSALKIFVEITDKVNSINTQVNQIVQASGEQAEGIRQTSLAITHVDNAAKDNSNTAVSTSQQSDTLRNLSQDLNKILEGLNIMIFGGVQPVIRSKKGAGDSSHGDSGFGLGGIDPKEAMDKAHIKSDLIENLVSKKEDVLSDSSVADMDFDDSDFES